LDKAQFMLGQFYEHGSGGLPVDFSKAMDYVSRAANLGKHEHAKKNTPLAFFGLSSCLCK
jgi:TPR repeat protein